MIIEVSPDKEKVKSILGLIKNREKFLSTIDIEKFSTIAAENYYEIIKELATSLLLLDGLKTTGDGAHKELIDYLSKYEEFSEYEISLMDDLSAENSPFLRKGPSGTSRTTLSFGCCLGIPPTLVSDS